MTRNEELLSVDTSRTLRLWRRLLVVLAGAVVLPITLLAFGTFFPAVPYLGTVGSLMLPLLAPQLAVVAIVGAGLAAGARRLGARRAGATLVVLGLVGAASAGSVIGRHVLVASSNGARVNVLAAVVPRGFGASAAPDATLPFTNVDG